MNMEQVTFPYSLKNIPLPSQKEYRLELISSVETFRSNFAWRCFHFLNPSDHQSKETYGFKTTSPAPSVPELKEFENEMLELVKNVKFKQNVSSPLQNTIKQNMREMNRESKLYVAADKTNNFYKVTPDAHKELLDKNITKEYKKVDDTVVKTLNKKDKEIAEELELDDRIYSITRRDAFITLKDHKDNFENNPKCRLINPSKSELGKVSKEILTRVVTLLRTKLKANSWKNTESVIKWFRNLENKKKLTFIQFDICEFYPSISETLLRKAIAFARRHVNISEQEIRIILQTKKGLLFKNKEVWIKKGQEPFDVTMGSLDGAEVCDLVGLYLLSQLSDLNLEIGLYRDDGLCVSSLTARQTDLAKKKLCSIFRDNGLNITVEANMKSVNFLDVNLNLENGTYKPFMKPNDKPTYVHAQSNHPPSILRNIPKSVNRRLSSISSNETIFNEASKPYQEALNSSGYNFELKFLPPSQTGGSKQRRQRKITWFNPPFSQSVKTNIGEKFLLLVDKCFPPNHVLRKIVNRNTVKISYRCMPNVKKSISRHNTKVARQEEQQGEQQPEPGCNCRTGPCPMNGNCLVDKLVYKATVRDENNTVQTYTGLTANTFKDRYYGHSHSFNHYNPNNSTTLSTHIWDLKHQGKRYDLEWESIDRAQPFNPTTRKCRLCQREKYYILFLPEGATLNKRQELYNTCRHRLKDLLTNT